MGSLCLGDGGWCFGLTDGDGVWRKDRKGERFGMDTLRSSLGSSSALGRGGGGGG